VYLGEDSTAEIWGYPFTEAAVDLYAGWNFIGWYDESSTNAELLGQSIVGCAIVMILDGPTQSFKTHIVGVPHNNFPIQQGMGIYVYVTLESTWLGDL
jgi:hypothetical protein